MGHRKLSYRFNYFIFDNPTWEFLIDDISLEPWYMPLLNNVEIVTWKQEAFEAPIDFISDIEIIDGVYFNRDYKTIVII